MLERKHWVLLAIFLGSLSLRLFLAFSIPNFTYDSYFHLRQVEQIMTSGVPLFRDPLSYGGRELIFLPLFHYVSAGLALLFPLEIVAKVLPNLLFALLSLATFFIAERISKRKNAALFAALVTALLPVTFQTNSFSPLPFALLFVLLSIYFFIGLRQGRNRERNTWFFILSLLALFFSSTLSFVLIFGLLFYVLLANVEEQKIQKREKELIFFASVLFLWTQFLFFKEVFLSYGLQFIRGNIPPQIIFDYFPRISLVDALLLVGVVPLLGGMFFIYTSIFEEKRQSLFLLVSFAIASILLTGLRLVPFEVAISFLGLLFAILFSSFYEQLLSFYERTRFSSLHGSLDKKIKKKAKRISSRFNFSSTTTLLILIVLLPSLLFPALSVAHGQAVPSDAEVAFFQGIGENTRSGEVVLTDVQEGHLVSYLSQRKNVLDSNFQLIEDVENRVQDLGTIYSTPFQTQAVKLLEKYGVDYIVLSSSAKERFGREKIESIDNECFKVLIIENGNEAYHINCALITS